MKKSTYFFITCLLLGNYWKNTYTVGLNLDDTVLVTGWIWCLIGFIIFRKESLNNPLLTIKNIKLLLYIFIGVLVSSFSAAIYHNETFYDIFIAQRQIYNWMYFILFLYIRPSIIDIEISLKKLSIIAIILFAISIKYPLLFISEQALGYRMSSASTDIGGNSPGLLFIVLYIYFLISKMVNNFSVKLFLIISFFIAIVILYQNRSMLIGVSVAYLIGSLNIKSRNKQFIIFFIILASGIIFMQFFSIFQSLWHETLSQLNNHDYNRWQALQFFLSDYNSSFFCNIFGNGTPTKGSMYLADLVYAQKTRNAYVSDIGMVGMYFYYGIIPLIIIYWVALKTILKHKYPFFLKFQFLHILLVPPIFEFAWSGAFFFSIIFYLFCYSSLYYKYNKPSIIPKYKYQLI